MQIKLYPKYKQSGIQWIGKIPEGWEVRKIKGISNTVAGGTPSTANLEYWDGDIPWLPSGMIHNNIIEPRDVFKFITLEGLNNSSTKKIRKGSPLIALTGATCGNIAYLTFEATANQSVVGIETNKDINSKYVFYHLLSQREQILINKTGGAQSGINEQNVKDIFCSYPSLSEQIAIAKFLDKKTAEIDELIEKDKQLIELLKEKRIALINHTVTKSLDSNANMKDSGIEWIGKVPEGWKVVPLLKFLESKVDYRGATPEKVVEGVFLVTGRNIKEGKIDYELSQEFVPEDQYKEIMHRGKPQIGDLLFTTEAPLGEVANVDNETVALAQRIIKMRGQKDKLNNYYLKYYIMTALFQRHLQSYATGSTALGIKASNMCFLRLIVPFLSEQLQIVQYLNQATAKIDKTIQKVKQKIALLEEYKKSLIHHVVTGKIDVREV